MAGAKRAFAVAQVVLPHADEAIVKALAAHLLDLAHERLSPQAERRDVVWPDVLEVQGLQIGARAGVQWRIADGLTLNSAVSVNDYRYGSAKPGAFFRETLFESALTTTF